MRFRLLAASVLALGFVTLPASAYTAYLLPRDFTPDTGAAVQVEAAYGTQFFAPVVGLSGPDMHVVSPSGARDTFTAQDVSNQRGIYDVSLGSEGTYRVTTGEILGPVTQMVVENGAWRALAQGETPPEGADTTTLQTDTVADTYFSRVRPSNQAQALVIGHLAIQPITHPNRISVATGFEVQVMLDGQPLPNMAVVLYTAGDPETKLDRFVTTDANGHATFTFTTPGTYIAVVRHRANAPTGSDAAVRSYTTSLTFEVMQDLPAIPPPPREDRQRRRDNPWRH
ncbi:MAG: DUF4198 domain-containing protein [Pseudomonadota bacterium]